MYLLFEFSYFPAKWSVISMLQVSVAIEQCKGDHLVFFIQLSFVRQASCNRIQPKEATLSGVLISKNTCKAKYHAWTEYCNMPSL